MEDPSRSIDSSLVPSMMELNVSEASDRAVALLQEMRESQELCKRLLDRLQFLRSELKRISSQGNATQHAQVSAQFANALGLVVRFLKKYSEKQLLLRIATSSALRREMRVLHAKIDAVFTAAGLAGTPEMTEWQQHEEADIAAQRRHMEEVLRSRTDLISDVSDSTLEEALAELKFEIDRDRGEPEETIALLVRVLDTVVELTGVIVPTMPVWFIRRDDVVLGEQFDQGSFGEVHRGVWNGKEVCVKLLLMDDADTQRDFLKETAVWHDLSHQNVVTMHGGCHVGKPLFFVSEYATKGNFVDYFVKKENKQSMWRLFHQAAQGLAYLHENRKVHCDIKCNNILVSEDGIAKLCDFGYSHTKTLSVGKSIKPQPSSACWKAPECLLEQGFAANPTFMSDVYSLGMTIIEAKIGGVPWGVQSGDDIVDQIASGEGYPRPEGIFTDKEWGVVQAMTAFRPTDRWTLDKAMAALAELALMEQALTKLTLMELALTELALDEENTLVCSSCQSRNRSSKKFCGDCGAALTPPQM
ncbi:Serine/threonine protein kinase [Globisporangium polare]